MKKINATTQLGRSIIWDYKNARYDDIFDAYDRPSSRKVYTFRAIERRAESTEGYNHDLRVAGRSSHQYSTVYSYTVNGVTTIVKDTAANTYAVEVVAL